MAKVLLKKLQCIVNDEVDEDEVFLKYNGQKIWPAKGIYVGIDHSESFEIDVEIAQENVKETTTIELWDFDFLSPNDFLGTFDFTIGDDTSGTFSTSMTLKEKGSSASYILHWEIIG